MHKVNCGVKLGVQERSHSQVCCTVRRAAPFRRLGTCCPSQWMLCQFLSCAEVHQQPAFIQTSKRCAESVSIWNQWGSPPESFGFYGPRVYKCLRLKPALAGETCELLCFTKFTCRCNCFCDTNVHPLGARLGSGQWIEGLEGWMFWSSPLHPNAMPLPTGSIGNAPRLKIQIVKSPGYIKAVSLFIKRRFDPARAKEALFRFGHVNPCSNW